MHKYTIFNRKNVFISMVSLFKKILEWLAFIFGAKENNIEIVQTGEIESGETQEVIEQEETEEMETHIITVLLDNGHASSTPGKRSPKEEGVDQFFEYEFNRDIVHRIAEKLDKIGIKYEVLVPEVDEDISLSTRAARANKFCKEYGKENCVFISVHANAAGNGTEWKNARGWCCYTSKGETASDTYAEIFMKCANDVLVPLKQKIRKYSAKKYSWEENFTVLVKTNCAAILTENMFYDNKDDLKFLQSDEGREAIAQIHIDAILEIEKNLGA